MKTALYYPLIMACSCLIALPAAADSTMTSRVTADGNGHLVVQKTMREHNAYGDTVTTRETTTDETIVPTPTSVTTVTTVSGPPVAIYNDDEYRPWHGGTYAVGSDRQGNNALRYENRTYDGYNN